MNRHSQVGRRLAWMAAFVASIAGIPLRATAQRADNPHGPNIGACSVCHRPNAWKPVAISKDFRHPGAFPLEGAHLNAACTACHRTLDFAHTSSVCSSCHTDVHHGEFGTQCARCHTTRSFIDPAGMRRMHELTQFPLRGAHAVAACEACHVPASPGQAQYANRPTTCFGCHASNYQQAKNPEHAAAGFSQVCSDCHSMVSWAGATFDHGATQFPLTGAHVNTACAACHGDGVFKGKPTLCVSCHQADFAKTTNPPHAASGFPTACETCHTTATWTGAVFDHGKTQFPLTGAHAATACTACHGDGVYHGKSTLCVSCHQADYTKTTDPSHVAGGFATTCESCHNTTTWTGAVFNHATTQFPLTGAHAAVACAACHGDGVFKGKSTLCVSCHQTDVNQTNNPPHAAAGFPSTCETCHTTSTWTGAVFDHATTQFPLTGGHVGVACAACHGDGVYKGKSTACASCHQTAFNQTTAPPHAAAGFPTTCDLCHSTASWTGAVFNHANTAFPLTGAHLAVACSACHGDGVYKGKPTACASCHQSDYATTNSPPHAAAGFPTTCETCHGTVNWTSATFDHNTTAFPLTGAHLSATCAACHGDGVYKGKPTACVACHLTDYNTTNNPAHAAAGFPQTCAQCHTTSTWAGATFDHDGSFFPIYSGTHKNRWSQCADCHTAPSNYAAFSCTTGGCHGQSTTNSHHNGVSGYRYESTACYACHPRGRSG